MADIEIWGKYGGLLGLVLFAGFTLVCIFINVIGRKDKDHRHFLERILEDERNERKGINQEHRVTYNRLSSSLDSLTDELKHNRHQSRADDARENRASE